MCVMRLPVCPAQLLIHLWPACLFMQLSAHAFAVPPDLFLQPVSFVLEPHGCAVSGHQEQVLVFNED